MEREPIRYPASDHLLTPQNVALVVINYRPSQVQTVATMNRGLLVNNIVSATRMAKRFKLPVVSPTVNVADGQGPTIPERKAELSSISGKFYLAKLG